MRDRFIALPNLPQKPVSLVLIGGKYAPLYQLALQRYSVAAVPLDSDSGLSPPLDSHADCIVLHLGDSRFACAQSTLPLIGIGAEAAVPASALGSYPSDSTLQCVIQGSRAICCRRTVHPSILDYLIQNRYDTIDVRQAYCKCSVCVVDEQSIITSDAGIVRAAEAAGIQCLQIRPGYIGIERYGYGFIGGCTGKLAADLLAFTGTLASHPDGERILSYIKSRNIRPVYLSDGPLVDVGSILPVREYL